MISQYIREYLNKNNPHHAYLIEGPRDGVVPEILEFCEKINIKTSGNPDFCSISIDNFKIDEAFDLRSMSNNKGFTSGKKVFVICANSISLDAQNVLLKMFEEPIYNTHFFLVVPDKNSLLKTLVSRFYLISTRQDLAGEEAEKFISMSLQQRIDFLKDLLIEPEENLEEEPPSGGSSSKLDSSRSKAIKFLNALELTLHKKYMSKPVSDISFFNHFFRVREFLRQPGSSTKNLMESVALAVPNMI